MPLRELASFGALYAASIVFDFVVLRRLRARVALIPFLVELAALLTAPLLIPHDAPVLRFYAAFFAGLKMVRLAEMAFGEMVDPAMLATPWRFALWLSVQGDARWPRDAAEASASRRAGIRLLGEGIAYLVVLGVFRLALPRASAWWTSLPLRTLVFLLAMGLAAPGLVALHNGGMMALTGVSISRAMNHPLMGTSIGNFWGKRWNLAFRDTAHRLVFRPLRRRRLPRSLAVIAVFVCSALVHEYLVAVVLGDHAGIMGSFFLLQGLLMLGEHALCTRFSGLAHSWITRAVLWVTLVVTAPLFFEPFHRMIPLATLLGAPP